MGLGYRQLANGVKRVPGLGWLAARMVFLLPDRVVTRDVDQLGRFSFRLRRHRWMLGKPLFATGHHAATLATFRAIVKPGDVVYDIGSNIGYYARLIARDMNPSLLVCFEPMTENAELLEANIAMFGERVRVLRMALSDHDGDELLQVDDVMGGTAVLDAVAGGKPSEARQHVGLGPKTESVKVARLDDVVQREKLPLPKFIKIDTEGAEALVLRGGIETLKASHPTLAIATHGEEPAREVIALLTSLGYRCEGEVGGATKRLDVADAGKLSDNNIVAIASPPAA